MNPIKETNPALAPDYRRKLIKLSQYPELVGLAYDFLRKNDYTGTNLVCYDGFEAFGEHCFDTYISPMLPDSHGLPVECIDFAILGEHYTNGEETLVLRTDDGKVLVFETADCTPFDKE